MAEPRRTYEDARHDWRVLEVTTTWCSAAALVAATAAAILRDADHTFGLFVFAAVCCLARVLLWLRSDDT